MMILMAFPSKKTILLALLFGILVSFYLVRRLPKRYNLVYRYVFYK